jgi:SAM-dependent methyltransferase
MSGQHPVRLHLGCGALYLDGYVNVDAYPPPDAPRPPDRLQRAEAIDDAPGSVDAIYASHVVEHLSRAEVLAAFTRWFDALRPGGVLTIEVPDAEAIMRRLLRQRDDARKDLYYYLLFGTQAADGEYHKGGWTFARLARSLGAVGFIDFVNGARAGRAIENRLALRMYRPRRWRAVLLECRKPMTGGRPNVDALRRTLFFDYQMQDLPAARLRRRIVAALPAGERLAAWWRRRTRRA